MARLRSEGVEGVGAAMVAMYVSVEVSGAVVSRWGVGDITPGAIVTGDT